MPIQPENKIFPHTIPPAPGTSDKLYDTVQNFQQWATDVTSELNELVKDLVTKYNGHLDQTHAHPKSWRFKRVRRPSFKSNTADTSQVLLDASSTSPQYFLVGANLLEATSQLVLDLDTSGVGGLRTGLSKAANTVYYLYAVNNSGSVALIADTVAPSTGLTGYTDWTYLGSFSTIAASAVAQFVSSNGKYISSANLSSSATHTGDTTISGQTLYGPLTAKFSIGDLLIDGATIGTNGSISGFNDTNNMTILQSLQVNGITVHQNAEVSLDAYNLIYLKVSNATTTATWRVHGWIEDPTEYQ